MNAQTRVVTSILALLLGLSLVIGAIYFKYVLYPALMRTTVESQLDLSQGTEARANWESPPADIYMAFRFFDVLNPDEVARGSKPRLVEIGPYVFKENRVKEGIVEFDGKISYGEAIFYYFDQAKTNEMGCKYANRDCTENDEINVINAPLLALNSMLPKPFGQLLSSVLSQDICIDLPIIPKQACINLPKTLRKLWRYLNAALNGENCVECFDTVIRKTTVIGELFTGQKSSTLLAFRQAFKEYLESDDGREFVGFIFELIQNALDLLGETDTDLVYPDTILDIFPESFPFLGAKNGSAVDNYFVIDDGSTDIRNFNKVVKFNGKNSLSKFQWSLAGATPSAQKSGEFGNCDALQGTTGTMFAPFVDKEKKLYLMTGELCRSLGLSFSKEEEVQGLNTFVYSADKSLLSASVPENLCYCPNFEFCAKENEGNNTWDLSECKKCKDGLLWASKCYFGAPVVMSQPHFLNADETIIAEIEEGLEPEKSNHDTFLNVEPTTGIVLKAHKRIQVNLHLQPNEELDVLKDVRDMVFPFMWGDEFALVHEEAVDELDFALNTIDLLVNTVAFAATVAIGLVTMATAVHLLRAKHDKYEFHK